MKDCLADFKEEDARHGSYGGEDILKLYSIIVKSRESLG